MIESQLVHIRTCTCICSVHMFCHFMYTKTIIDETFLYFCFYLLEQQASTTGAEVHDTREYMYCQYMYSVHVHVPTELNIKYNEVDQRVSTLLEKQNTYTYLYVCI